MANKKLDLTKPVQTRSGKPVRILCTDRKGFGLPVIGLVESFSSPGADGVYAWSADGRYVSSIATNDLDLVNVPKRTVEYVNIYTGDYAPLTSPLSWDMGGIFYDSIVSANEGAGTARTGLLKLTFEDDKIVAAEVVDA